MRNSLIILLALSFTSCKRNNQLNLNQITTNYNNKKLEIERVEYLINRIDSFSNGLVWNNKGYGLIEKDFTDSLFGFSFYGKRFDNQNEVIYYKGNGFIISPKTKSYSIKNNLGIRFSDAGQMIVTEFFEDLPSEYKSVELIDIKGAYQIRYNFEDNEAYQTTDDHLIIVISKNNFLPQKITYSSISAGKKQVHQINLEKIAINSDVSSKISEKSKLIKDYSWIEKGTKNKQSKYVDTVFPKMVLPNLKTQKEYQFKKGKITLIDFWATWCGPCIKSFPKVEELHNEYKERINIIGVVLENRKSALELIKKSEITYMNLLGTNKTLEEYDIQSLPAYFLIDKEGIIKKYYTGLNLDTIRKDINSLLKEE